MNGYQIGFAPDETAGLPESIPMEGGAGWAAIVDLAKKTGIPAERLRQIYEERERRKAVAKGPAVDAQAATVQPKDPVSEMLNEAMAGLRKPADWSQAEAAARTMTSIGQGAVPAQIRDIDPSMVAGTPRSAQDALSDVSTLLGQAPSGLPGDTAIKTSLSEIDANRGRRVLEALQAGNQNRIAQAQMENQARQAQQVARTAAGKTAADIQADKIKEERLRQANLGTLAHGERKLASEEVIASLKRDNDFKIQQMKDNSAKLVEAGKVDRAYADQYAKNIDSIEKMWADPADRRKALERFQAQHDELMGRAGREGRKPTLDELNGVITSSTLGGQAPQRGGAAPTGAPAAPTVSPTGGGEGAARPPYEQVVPPPETRSDWGTLSPSEQQKARQDYMEKKTAYDTATSQAAEREQQRAKIANENARYVNAAVTTNTNVKEAREALKRIEGSVGTPGMLWETRRQMINAAATAERATGKAGKWSALQSDMNVIDSTLSAAYQTSQGLFPGSTNPQEVAIMAKVGQADPGKIDPEQARRVFDALERGAKFTHKQVTGKDLVGTPEAPKPPAAAGRGPTVGATKTIGGVTYKKVGPNPEDWVRAQ